jgi:hypothetical protein
VRVGNQERPGECSPSSSSTPFRNWSAKKGTSAGERKTQLVRKRTPNLERLTNVGPHIVLLLAHLPPSSPRQRSPSLCILAPQHSDLLTPSTLLGEVSRAVKRALLAFGWVHLGESIPGVSHNVLKASILAMNAPLAGRSSPRRWGYEGGP